jgi:hypothetical protein
MPAAGLRSVPDVVLTAKTFWIWRIATKQNVKRLGWLWICVINLKKSTRPKTRP